MREPALSIAAALLAVTACSSMPRGMDGADSTATDREAWARDIVRSAFAERGSRIPRRPGEREADVLLVDRRLVVVRPLATPPADAEGARGSHPAGEPARPTGKDRRPPVATDAGPAMRVLLFEDVDGLERRTIYDFPSRPEDLSIYVRRESPSVIGALPEAPLLAHLRLGNPVLHLRMRPEGTCLRFRKAVDYLLSLPPPRNGPGPRVEALLRRLARGEIDRSDFQEAVQRAIAKGG